MAGMKANSWKVSKSHREKATNDPVYHARLVAQGQAAAKTYQLTSPLGELVIIHNMSKFCRENGLTKSCMLRVAMGKDRIHKGWTKPLST